MRDDPLGYEDPADQYRGEVPPTPTVPPYVRTYDTFENRNKERIAELMAEARFNLEHPQPIERKKAIA